PPSRTAARRAPAWGRRADRPAAFAHERSARRRPRATTGKPPARSSPPRGSAVLRWPFVRRRTLGFPLPDLSLARGFPRNGPELQSPVGVHRQRHAGANRPALGLGRLDRVARGGGRNRLRAGDAKNVLARLGVRRNPPVLIHRALAGVVRRQG